MISRLRRFWKYAASFVATNWSLDSYPIRIRESTPAWDLPPDSHLKPVKWTAQIDGWPTMGGHGDGRDEAFANLAERFQQYVASGKALPRPGTDHMDIEFASTDRLAEVEYLAPRFFDEVIGMDYGDCLITDESSLWDFHAEADNEQFFARIQEIYGVNVRDIESGRIVDILLRLKLLSPSA